VRPPRDQMIGVNSFTILGRTTMLRATRMGRAEALPILWRIAG
jgi:hypothetical protein